MLLYDLFLKAERKGLDGIFSSLRAKILTCLFELRRGIYLKAVKGKRGLEIGGPSGIFAPDGLLPVYELVTALDGADFNDGTIWREKQAGSGYEYLKGRPAGVRWICEASDMGKIGDAVYDFILASHVLEHLANPLKALSEWKRIVKPGGFILILLPERRRTFDHKRPITLVSHLAEDLERGTMETDLTHLPEIMELHDLGMDLPAGSAAQFLARSKENYKNRSLHHHVFDRALAVSACELAGLKIVRSEVLGVNIFVLARKP